MILMSDAGVFPLLADMVFIYVVVAKEHRNRIL